MIDAYKLRKRMMMIKVIGALFLLLGLADIALRVSSWMAAMTFSLDLSPLIDLLMIVGGFFLLKLRDVGRETLFIVLRLNILFGALALIASLLMGKLQDAVLLAGLLVATIIIMVFLSHEKTSAILQKEELIK